LEQDVFLRIASIEHDAEYKKLREPADNQALEKAIEEAVMPREGEEPLDEETKAATQKRTRHKLLTKAFNFIEAKDAKPKFREHGKAEGEGAPAYQPLPANQWKEAILTFAKYTVVKMPRVFQAVFYLLGYQREEICERDTNKLEWKKARLVLLGPTHDGAEFFKRLADFHPFGAKEGHFKLYQKLRFLKKLLRRHEQAPEQVEEYSVPLAKLFKWLLYSMELRAGDVVHRRELKNKLKEERRVAEEAFQERERVRNEALEHARTVSHIYLVCQRLFRITKPRRMRDLLLLKTAKALLMKAKRRDANSTKRASSASGIQKT
jgi:hypothetical protein